MVRRFQDIWKDQCKAAADIAVRHGKVEALDYLIGEKLDQYAQTAATRAEFARELPQFIAAIRQTFARDDLFAYFTALEANARKPNSDIDTTELEDAGLLLTADAKASRINRLHELKVMLLSPALGTA